MQTEFVNMILSLYLQRSELTKCLPATWRRSRLLREPYGQIVAPTRVDIMIAAISDGISTLATTPHRVPTMILALLLTVLTSCAITPPPMDEIYSPATRQELTDRVLGGPQDLVVPVDILEFGSDLKEYVDSRIDRRWTPQRRLKGLRNMLFGPENLDIRYDHTKTKTAMETFETKLGNCLSLTNLFISAARYMNLDAHYQVVAIKPTWEKSGTILINNEHINAVGKMKGGISYSIDFLPEVYYDEPKSYPISDEEALGRYYSNLGVEQIVNGDVVRAISYLRTAISIYPALADSWNNMGAAQRRLGNDDLSEFSYLRAVQIDGRYYTAMSNLARFYEERGERRRASHYLKRVESFRAQNPYYLYHRATIAIEKRDYRGALRNLKKAIARKDNEPEFYVALAELYHRTGAFRKSEANMAKAAAFSDDKSDLENKMEILIH
jgi:Tfp pilus assembly protein PilF